MVKFMKEVYVDAAAAFRAALIISLGISLFVLCASCTGRVVRVTATTTTTRASTTPAQPAIPENTVLLEDGQSLELLEDITVKGRIPFSGDELYTGNVGIKKGTMIVKPRMDGPVKSTPVPPEIIVPMPMTREEKVKRFQLAEAEQGE